MINMEKVTKIYSYEFNWAQIVSSFENATPQYIEVSNNEGDFAYFQYLKRDISKEIKELEKNKYFDIITPFDYGAFYYTNKEILEKLLKEFCKRCINENIISAFFRFNPLIKQDWNIINKYIDVKPIQEHIYIDLNEEYLNNFSKRKLRNIKKAQSLNPEFITNTNIEDFYNIYIDSMQRINATNYFLFSKESLKKLHINFGRIFSLKYKNKVVTAIFIIEDSKNVYYFLGGTLKEFLPFGFNSLLFKLVCDYYKGHKNLFFLGGGKDGLYKFKEEFSKDKKTFYIGNKVFDKNLYDKLTKRTKRTNNQFFPKYREKTI